MMRYFCCTLLLAIIAILLCKDVSSLHTSFCIRLPSGSFPDSAYAGAGGTVASVGVEKFPQDIWGLYYFATNAASDDGSQPSALPELFYKSEDLIEMQVFTITGSHSREDPLNGWYRVEISSRIRGGFQSGVKSFILYAVDEQQNFIGEFVYDFPSVEQGECHPSSATKHMVIPCGGVSKYEPIASNMILFARNDSSIHSFPAAYKDQWPIVPTFGARKPLSFYFRMSMLDSNRNRWKIIVFRLFAELSPESNPHQNKKLLISQTAWFRLKENAVPGAADPLPTDLSTDCSSRMESFRSSHHDGYEQYLSRGWNWYVITYSDEWTADAQNDGYQIRPKAYLHVGCVANFFGGRCHTTFCANSLADQEYSASTSAIPIVHTTKSACDCSRHAYYYDGTCIKEDHNKPTQFNGKEETFRPIEEVYRRETVGRRKCNQTKDQARTQVIKVIRRKQRRIVYIPGSTNINRVFQDQTGAETREEELSKRGIRVYGFGTLLYGVRKGHGILMCIATFFCVPFAIFVSRFYKESFMNTRILFAKVWLQLHIQMVFWMGAFYVSGMILAVLGRSLIGTSVTPAALAHRILGWITFGIFVFTALTGGIRWFDEPGRKYSIMLHLALGYLIYILNVILVVLAIYIPGSPIAHIDVSYKDFSDPDQSNFLVFVTLSLWIIFELITHATLNFLLHSYDRWMKVEQPRLYIPTFIGVPIPVLKENSSQDAPGQGAREIAFWLYIGISVFMVVGISSLIIHDKYVEDFGFGATHCTHNKTAKGYVLMKHLHPSCRAIGQ